MLKHSFFSLHNSNERLETSDLFVDNNMTFMLENRNFMHHLPDWIGKYHG